jgi:hypothetical protein
MATYLELAYMAAHVYDFDSQFLNKHVHVWHPIEQTKIGRSEAKGVVACIYRNIVSGECVFVVKGTSPSSTDDLISDMDFFLDSYWKYRFIPELAQLLKHMFILRTHFPEYKFTTITGHSLGGILSKMAGAITGDADKILAFNSPGVQAALNYVPKSILYSPKKVETIATSGDHIGNFKWEHDIGRYIKISNIASSDETRIASAAAIGIGGAIAGAGQGALVGSIFPGAGTAIGAVIGGVAGGVGGVGWLSLQEHSMLGVIKSMASSKYNFHLNF